MRMLTGEYEFTQELTVNLIDRQSRNYSIAGRVYQESWLDFVRLNGKCPTSVKNYECDLLLYWADDDGGEETSSVRFAQICRGNPNCWIYTLYSLLRAIMNPPALPPSHHGPSVSWSPSLQRSRVARLWGPNAVVCKCHFNSRSAHTHPIPLYRIPSRAKRSSSQSVS